MLIFYSLTEFHFLITNGYKVTRGFIEKSSFIFIKEVNRGEKLTRPKVRRGWTKSTVKRRKRKKKKRKMMMKKKIKLRGLGRRNKKATSR